MKKRTELYYPDGRMLVREWEDGTRPHYEWLRRAVEGYIEIVDRFLPDGGPDGRTQAYCNEEGRLLGLLLNVPGMKAINWPEPPQGWDALGPFPEAPESPVLIFPEMPPDELAAAMVQISQWSPVVGPIVILRGWSEADYDDEVGLNPDDLGQNVAWRC